MDHGTIRVLAEYAVFFIVALVMPMLILMFTDRLSHNLDPREYALLFGLAGLTGILLFVPAISIIGFAALGGLGIAWLSARYSFSGLTYGHSFETDRLFPGDETQFRVEVENRKLLPLASLTITNPIQFGLMMPGEKYDDRVAFSTELEVLDDQRPALEVRTAMGPYQSLTRSIRVHARHRGVYRFAPGELEAGDAFGIFSRATTRGSSLELIVYPRIYRQEELDLPFREALGEVISRRSLIEDPTLIAGTREYRPGDPLRRMHWKATARTGDLQVRIFDPSTTAQVMFLLNLNTSEHAWEGIDLDRMESVIEIAGSLSTWALERDFPVGVRSNGVVYGTYLNPRVAPSASPRQSAVILEHLARLAFSGHTAPEALIADEARRLSSGGSIVFVTSSLTPPVIGLLTSRSLRGRVSVVYCGRYAAPVVRGLPVHLVSPRSAEVSSVAS